MLLSPWRSWRTHGRRVARRRTAHRVRSRLLGLLEHLEPRQLLATYVWDPKNDGSTHSGWQSTNTGDYLQVQFQYPNNTQWTAPQHFSDTIFASPPLRVTTGIGPGNPLYNPSYEIPGPALIDQPGNWSLPDYPNAVDADVSIGAGSSVILSGFVNFPYAGSPPLSGTVAVATLDNAGALLVHGTGVLNVHGTSFINNGTIQVAGSLMFRNAAATPLAGSGSVVLSGGSILRPDQGQNTISVSAGQSIHGSGSITVPITTNAGGITADAGGTLTVSLGGGSMVNTATLEATTAGDTVTNSVLALSGGTIVNTAGTIRAVGQTSRVSLTGATVVGGTLATSGAGVIQVSGGTFDSATAAITNAASLDVTGSGATWKGSVANAGLVSVQSFASLKLDAGVTVNGAGAMKLNGGALSVVGSGVLTDIDNPISGRGAINGDAGSSLSLASSLTADGGSLTVSIPVATTATGVLAATNGGILTVTGKVTGSGTIMAGDGSTVDLRSAEISPTTALLTSGTGRIILSGSIDGSGAGFQTAANVQVTPAAGSLAVGGSIGNGGLIDVGFGSIVLSGDTTLSGAGIVTLAASNAGPIVEGTISGTGTFTNADNTITGLGSIGDGLTAVVNSGTVRAVGGSDAFFISFLAPTTNTATGTMETDATASLGFGTDFVNRGTVAANSVAALGSVTNAAGASYSVTGQSSSVYGTFTNAGTLTVATQTDALFATLSHGTSGVQISTSGRIVVTDDFLNQSTQAASWSTTGATLSFYSTAASASHRFQLAGLDLGSAAAGWTSNFAWGGLSIASGHTLSLESGRGDGQTAAGYVAAVTGAVIDAATQSISNITGNGLNLYYDPAVGSNAYLFGKTYALQGGGFLVPKGALGVPTALAVTGGSGQVGLSWTAPALAGNPAVTDYVIQVSTNNGSSWTTFNDGSSTTPSTTVTGLVNGTTYRFRVAAKYVTGTSDYGVPSVPVLVGAPSVPTGVAAYPGNGRMTVAWTAPAQNGAAISGYVIEYKATGESGSTSADGAMTNGTVFALTNGTPYVFRVAIKNAFGTGPFSPYTAAVAPTTQPYAPSAPRGVAGTAGDGQVIVSWSPPLIDGNASITDYVVQYGTNGTDWTTFDDGTSANALAIVNGLSNGTGYVFRVAAKNSAGTGVFSAASSAVTPTGLPGLPQSPVATAANGQVSLSWSAPASDGGAAITDYVVRYIGPDGPVVVADGVSPTTSTTVTGLTNGATYFFSVAAVNSAGQGSFTSTVSAMPRTVPNQPTAVAGTPAAGRVNLTWSMPAFDGGATITDYRIEYSTNNGGSWNVFNHAASSSPFIAVNGLTDGTSYVFRVAAINVAGTGGYSANSAAVVPKGVPGIPLDVIGTPGNGQVSLDWSDPSDPGASAITDYTIQYSSNDGSSWTTFKDAVSASSAGLVTGLTNGTAYVFRVAAINALGTGGYSPVSLPVTPRTVPNAPTAVTATAGNRQAALSWSAPTVTGGAAVNDYVVQYSTDSGTTWMPFDDGTASSVGAVVAGLTNGMAYVFRVAAVNAAGQGAFSAKSAAVTPRDVPGLPTGVVATPGNGGVALTWSAPNEPGAGAISDYTIQYSSDGGGSWKAFADGTSTATSAAVTGLKNGTSYIFRVAAVNSLGAGLFSIPSAGVTPRTFPNAPTGVKATAGDGQVSLSWSAPAVTGGAAIVDYVVQYSSNGGGLWTDFADGPSSATTAVVGGLSNGTSYVFRVAAVNIAGQSPFSASSGAAMPRILPGAPPAPVGVAGNAQVSLSWTAPAAPGQTITDYAVQVSTDNGATWKDYSDGKSASPSATVKSLTNGTTYRFRVAAMTTAGTGPYSVASSPVTPRTTAGAPTGLAGTLVNGQVTLTWKAPASNGGAAITGYVVQYSADKGKTWTNAPGGIAPATSAAVTGLANGTSYTFRVAAVNAAGTGAFSGSAGRLTPKVPIDPAVYQGTYAGTFTGAKAFGTISATISGTSIAVDILVTAPGTQIVNAPASGTGTIAADGSFSFAAQGAIFGATYVGQIVVGQNGQVTANGTWKYSTIASGTWQVSRVPSGT